MMRHPKYFNSVIFNLTLRVSFMRTLMSYQQSLKPQCPPSPLQGFSQMLIVLDFSVKPRCCNSKSIGITWTVSFKGLSTLEATYTYL